MATSPQTQPSGTRQLQVPSASERGLFWLRDKARRMRNRLELRWYDNEVRNLRRLQRSFSGPTGCEVLVIADSFAAYVPRSDRDKRTLVDMVCELLPSDVRVCTIAGPGYNVRIAGTFLDALERCATRPKVLVLALWPTSVMDLWLDDPTLGYGGAVNHLGALIEGHGRGRRVPLPTPEQEAAYDAMTAPGIDGRPKSVAEVRLAVNAVPRSAVQKRVRVRHIFDAYFGQELQPDDRGVLLLAELGRRIAAMGIRCVGFQGPLDVEGVRSHFGAAGPQRLGHNARVIAEAFGQALGDAGEIVEGTFDAESRHFGDPLHLRDTGRRLFAVRLADAIDRQLDRATQRAAG